MSVVFQITGQSDDLIEIDGDVSEELNVPLSVEDPGVYLACYDGTLLQVNYDEDGIWRFRLLARGDSFVSIDQDDPVDDNTYSDVVHFTDVNAKRKCWFVLGEETQTAT